jgi:hypothetical protein
VKAEQAKAVYSFRNTEEKLLKTDTAIWVIKIYKTHQFAPKCINIQLNGNNNNNNNNKNNLNTKKAATTYSFQDVLI